MVKVTLVGGCLFGFIAVAFGAMGAHALKTRIEPEMLSIFETAVRYQFFHALFLLILGAISLKQPGYWLNLSSAFIMSGIIIFSGSLYALSLSGIKTFGAITPIGGVLFLAGWFFAALHFSRIKI